MSGILRTVRRLSVVALAGAALAACSSSGPAPAPSAALFEGAVTIPGRTLSAAEEDQLLVQRALRRIDPCAFVDLETVAAAIPATVGYGEDLTAGGCVYYGSTSLGVELTTAAGTSAARTFQAHGVTVSDGSRGTECAYTIDLGLAALPGAPTGPAAAHLLDRTELRVSTSGGLPCATTGQLADQAALTVSRGLPIRRGAAVDPLADRDPCAVLAKLPGTARLSLPTAPEAAADPHGCGITAPDVRVSLVGTDGPLWDGGHPANGSPEVVDGVTVDFTADCDVTVRTGPPVQRVPVRPGATDALLPQYPAVVVTGKSCADNKHVAAVAAQLFGTPH
ncbi:hypothetical protein [Nocardia stercoris]|uniref:DUF3558 domain-containing protein n=1 Tax=Nocardia stercoris TaxID=2483361 RepID=A0A3M2LGS7_9NOCA|nr:hypothetical protein [Nocardia stercoris]RMI35165.1 hypothetical protein EBN03_02350 [Nocardia stercoris]